MNLKKVPQTDYEEQQHGPVYNFLYSMWTHILTLMSVNVLFMIFNIPMMLVAFGFTLLVLPHLNSIFVPENFAAFMYNAGVVGNEAINDVGEGAAYQIYYLIVVFCVMFLLGSTVFVIGPFQAGFTQIYRNLYRQEGVFLFTDFKEGMKNNWKQSLAASVISIAFSAVCMLAAGFYLNTGTRFGTAAATFFVMLFFVFIIIQNMVYMMIVSRDIPLPKIYKNAFLFFLMKFGPCLGMLLILFVALILIPSLLLLTTTYFAYAVVVFYYLTFIVGIVQYTLAYFTGELIREYIAPLTPEPESGLDDEVLSEEDEEDEATEDPDAGRGTDGE